MLIVTDGAVDLPPALEFSGRVRVVAGEIWVGDAVFQGVRDEFWSILRRGTFLSTTPPTVNTLTAAYRHDGLVLGVHVSAELSATVTRALGAAQRAGAGVVVVDSCSLSVGAGLVAVAIDQAALNREPDQSIIDVAKSLPDQLHTFVLVQDAEPLRRGGRAGLLPRDHVRRGRPLLLAVRGRAIVLEQPKDRSRALRQLTAHARHSADGGVADWALGHGDAADLDEITERLSQSLGSPPAYVVSIDPTVGAHVGADAVVLGVMARPAKR